MGSLCNENELNLIPYYRQDCLQISNKLIPLQGYLRAGAKAAEVLAEARRERTRADANFMVNKGANEVCDFGGF